MKKLIAVLVLLIAFATVSAIAGQSKVPPIEYQPPKVSKKLKRIIVREGIKEFHEKLDPVIEIKNPQIKNYLQGITQKLVINSPAWFAQKQYRTYIVYNNGFSAQSFVNGNIIIDITFLCSFQSEDALAWFLSHEITHIGFEHYLVESLVIRGPKSYLLTEQIFANEIEADTYGAKVAASAGYLVTDISELKRVVGNGGLYYRDRTVRAESVMREQQLWVKDCPNCNPTSHPLPNWFLKVCKSYGVGESRPLFAK